MGGVPQATSLTPHSCTAGEPQVGHSPGPKAGREGHSEGGLVMEDRHAPASMRTGPSLVRALRRMAGLVTVVGGGDRERWPGQLCACSQTRPPWPGKPQPRGTVPRRAEQASAAPASRLPCWRAGRGTEARAPSADQAAATGRDRPLPRDPPTPPASGPPSPTRRRGGQTAPPASWLSGHRRGPP